MNRREISERLKQDISKLVELALDMTETREKHDQIVILRNCIYAGLSDYELAWLEEVKRQVADEQISAREEE